MSTSQHGATTTSQHVGKEYDDSPPRNGMIFFYAVLTVFALLGVKFLLDSYFVKTMDAEVHAKILTQGFDQVTEMRAKEQAALVDSIGAAKKQVALGRTAAPLIRPASGAGLPEVQGWTQLGRKVEGAVPASAPAPAPSMEPAVQPGAAPNPNAGKPASSVNPASRPQ